MKPPTEKTAVLLFGCLCLVCLMFMPSCIRHSDPTKAPSGKPSKNDSPARLVEFLKSNDPEIVAEAVDLLVEKKGDSIPAVVKYSDEMFVPFQGPLIERIGSDAVDPLIDLLSKATNRVEKASAIMALGFVGPPAQKATDLVIGALSDPNARVRMAACDTLGQIQTHAPQARDALIASLSDMDLQVAEAAAFALGSVASPGDTVAIDALQAPSPNDRSREFKVATVYALYQLGYKQDEMFNRIQTEATTRPGGLAAIRALAIIGNGAAFDTLGKIVKTAGSSTRCLVLQYLSLSDPQPAAIQILVDELNALDDSERAMAMLTLASYGPGARSALSALENMKDGGKIAEYTIFWISRDKKYLITLEGI